LVELCIHIANVLYLASFLGRDMLWLRVFTCAGLVLGIVFFTCQPMPLYGPTVWHIVFLFINGLQIRRLIVERRQLMLNEEEEKAAEAVFQQLSREEMLTLLTRAMFANPRRLRDLREACRQQLTREEKIVRDIAFRSLSRKDLLNLLTRRLGNTIKMLNPTRWRRGQGSRTAPAAPAPVAAEGPAGAQPRPA
jgi:hypothetical protein